MSLSLLFAVLLVKTHWVGSFNEWRAASKCGERAAGVLTLGKQSARPT